MVTPGKGVISTNSSQVVLITGSSTGFGRLFTETLARKRHTVFATMRDPGGRNAKNAAELRTLAQKESLPIDVLTCGANAVPAHAHQQRTRPRGSSFRGFLLRP